MIFGLENKNVLITGGSRGIGKAIALAFAERGSRIVICGRTETTLDTAVDEMRKRGSKAWSFVSDVSDYHALENLVSNAAQAMGGIDILINNAVTSGSAPFDKLTDEMFRYHIDVKLMAYIRLARLVLPYMQSNEWGRVVNIGGMTARIIAPLRMTNGVVNAGVSNFTKQFANYTARHNVTVNCIHPGYTATERVMEIFKREALESGKELEVTIADRVKQIPLGKLIQPDDLANAVLFFCSSHASMITGQCLAVDGGSADAVMY